MGFPAVWQAGPGITVPQLLFRMKLFSFALVLFLIVESVGAQGVRIGETAGPPDESAIFETESTSKGFLPPRMSTAERNLIQNPAAGLIVFNTDKSCMEYHRGGGNWYSMCPILPEITTQPVTVIHGRSATCSGAVTDEGNTSVTARGFCWSVNPGPTIADHSAPAGSGAGVFSAVIGELDYSTTYYVRAYASNSIGTAYGNEVMFTTGEGTLVAYAEIGTDSWNVPEGVRYVDVLIVGAGGGGGGGNGGGGGAGGLIFRPAYDVSAASSYVVKVGEGGVGTTNSEDPGSNGASSEFGNLVALGGGGGGRWTQGGVNGGSGGGGSGRTGGAGGTGTQSFQPGNSGTFGHGKNGGAAQPAGSTGQASGGGGGGAGTVGANGVLTLNGYGGNGGAGLYQVTIGSTTYRFADLFGTTYGEIIDGEAWFAGGGAGGGVSSPGTGGNGGGGNGSTGTSFPTGEAGQANTGGGGGGGVWGSSGSGGTGGSGIVLIRY